MSQIIVSAIICSYNREDYILQALNSIKNQEYDKRLYELVIVNNNSTDNTPKICEEFVQHAGELQVTYVTETNQGLSYARNRGITESKGKYLCFIDDDAIACQTYVSEVVKFFEKHANVHALGGKILPKFDCEVPNWLPKHLTPLFSILDLGELEKPFNGRKYPVGANMAFHKTLFKEHGDFNTSLGRVGKNLMGGEEKDIFFRFTQEGGTQIWYAPKPWVYHIIPPTRATKDFIRKQAIGVGVSERFRVRGKFLKMIHSLLMESIKWAGSIVLALGYLFKAQPSKSKMLILFRKWVTGGLLGFYGQKNV